MSRGKENLSKISDSACLKDATELMSGRAYNDLELATMPPSTGIIAPDT